jgi:hypothetical protein
MKVDVFGFIRRFFPDFLRSWIAPVTVRFAETEDLQDTMALLQAAADKPRLERSDSLDATVERMQVLIGRELLRRGVRFWMEV